MESPSDPDLFSFSDCFLHWQPIIGLESRRMIGMEALLRVGRLSPEEALAEIGSKNEWKAFTKWAMKRILSDLSTLAPFGGPFLAFFNLSPGQCVPDWIVPAVDSFPGFVTPVAEVTEDALSTEQMKALRTVREKTNVMIAVDDFGTGHSNVDRLLDLPVDFIKIDRKLIQAAVRSDRDLVGRIVRSLGNSSRTILGEGIETEAHARFAEHVGCAMGQGWLYGKPMPIRELSRIFLSAPA